MANLIDRSKDIRRTLWICAFLVAITLAGFWPVLRNGFTSLDDLPYVTNNPHVVTGLTWPNVVWAFQIGYAGNWHPVTWLSHMLDAQIFGLNPGGHHATSLLLHIASTVLLFLVLKGMTGAPWRSAFVAALFALHPLHVESVAWIAERKDVLSAFFFMLTLWAYGRYVETKRQDYKTTALQDTPSRITHHTSRTHHASRTNHQSPLRTPHSALLFYCFSLLFFALGLMSKPMLVTLPFVLFLLDYWPLRRFELKIQNSKLKIYPPSPPSPPFTLHAPRSTLHASGALLAEKAPFLALSVLSSVVTFIAQRRGGAVAAFTAVPLELRVENALVSYVTYLEKMFWPMRLAAYYPLPPSIAPGQLALTIVVLAAISVTAFVTLRTRPYIGVGWLWYLAMLAPVIGLVQVGGQSHADRYTYLPLIGVFVAITWVVTDWEAVSATSPTRPTGPTRPTLRLTNNRSVLLTLCGVSLLVACTFGARSQALVWNDSETLYRHALAVTSRNAFVHVNLGNELLRQQKYDEAVEHFAEAVRLDSRLTEPRGSWAFVLATRGKLDEAVAMYRSAIELEPDRPLTHFLLANTLISQHKREEAISEYQSALRLDPSLWQAHTELGTALAQEGKVEEALREYETALGLTTAAKPGEGRREGARPFAPPEALRPRPDYARAHHQYGMLLARAGKLPQAEQHLREALRLNPDFQTYQDLALVLTAAGQPEAAVAQYKEALRLRPDSAIVLNNLAWILAASPSETVRNGSEAVKLAEQACQLTRFQQPIFIGTLAAAYAEARQFQDAINTAEKAIAVASSAGQKDVAERNQQLLELYRVGKPFHEAPSK